MSIRCGRDGCGQETGTAGRCGRDHCAGDTSGWLPEHRADDPRAFPRRAAARAPRRCPPRHRDARARLRGHIGRRPGDAAGRLRVGRQRVQRRLGVDADLAPERGPGIGRQEGAQARHGSAPDRTLAEQGHDRARLLLAHDQGHRPPGVLVHAAPVRLLLQGGRREHRDGQVAGCERGGGHQLGLRRVHELAGPPRQHHGQGLGRGRCRRLQGARRQVHVDGPVRRPVLVESGSDAEAHP